MSAGVPEKAYQLGKEYEQNYKGCSQSVVAAIQDAFNIRNDDVFKAATGLAAGGGLCIDGSCGAYAGAIMVLSTLLGRERDDFADRAGVLFRNFDLIEKLREKVIQEYGSVLCRDIQTKVFGRAYCLADMDELEEFEKAGGHDARHCPEVVGKAARWAAELIIAENLIPQRK
jgi:C_GCAxxG_C_C family probable redox protein